MKDGHSLLHAQHRLPAANRDVVQLAEHYGFEGYVLQLQGFLQRFSEWLQIS